MINLAEIATQVHEARRIVDMFANMHKRCYDRKSESYLQYGGRGIEVCERWFNLDLFEADIKAMIAEGGYEHLPANFSLERLDGSGNYSPENCTLADRRTQARNKCNVVRVEFGGIEVPLIELCERFDRYPYTIRTRIKSGQSVEEALAKTTQRTFQDYLLYLEQRKQNYNSIKVERNAKRRADYAQRKQAC